MKRHWMYLLLIFAMTAAVYAKVTGAYFCAYDDFLEVHRAAFEDSRNVSEVFTTPHMHSLKYRPLNRLLILWTYYAGGENPLYYRVRNLAFHLANVALVYSLAYLLFASIPV
ncbi:MAG TPA: hypothetical protein VGH16_07360, partial [Candidatus Binatia bacterium]